MPHLDAIEYARISTVINTWGGQLHEVDAQKVPSVATGAFEASYGGIGRMIGAFGATLDE
ncbi:MAG: hypothetical protein OXE57_08480 [Alphaproteobacteria bacterium]|nr:hypothetical protein [Alphaproteobacteria bacterium]